MPEGDFPLRCHCRHHEVTSLRCARCGVPICPHCSVVFPAGMLCKECARPSRGTVWQIKPIHLVLSAIIAFVVSTLLGWFLLAWGSFFGLLGALLFAFLHGMVVGETLRRVAHQRGGELLHRTAWGCAAGGILVATLVATRGQFAALLSIGLWLQIVLSVIAAHNRVRAF